MYLYFFTKYVECCNLFKCYLFVFFWLLEANTCMMYQFFFVFLFFFSFVEAFRHFKINLNVIIVTKLTFKSLYPFVPLVIAKTISFSLPPSLFLHTCYTYDDFDDKIETTKFRILSFNPLDINKT